MIIKSGNTFSWKILPDLFPIPCDSENDLMKEKLIYMKPSSLQYSNAKWH